jgi:protein-disulfide isomerase
LEARSYLLRFAFLLLWITAAVGWLVYVRHERELAYKELVKGRIADWRNIIVDRQPTVGSKGAPSVIIEFSDFQCPYCRSTETFLKDFASSHPGKVALYRLNLPLESVHPYAMTAAIAAECAASQGILEPYQEALFENQKAFATLDWVSLAAAKGVPDINSFQMCNKQQQTARKVDDDLNLANRLGISVTLP